MLNYFLKFLLKGKDFSRKIFYFLKDKKQKQYNRIKVSNPELMPFPLRRELIVNKKRRYLRGDEYLFYMGEEFESGLTLLIKKLSLICRNEIVLDVGANTDCKPSYLHQFALRCFAMHQFHWLCFALPCSGLLGLALRCNALPWLALLLF